MTRGEDRNAVATTATTGWRMRALLVLAAALVATLGTVAVAQAEELKPLVLVLVDTSNSMEYNNGPGDVLPTCYTGTSNQATTWCSNGAANVAHTKSRMTVAIEALTGQFNPAEYRCCVLERSSQEPDPLVYHYAVPETVAQIDNGIMDIYREEVRFGLMTFDNHPDKSSGNSGFYSYGGGTSVWNSGALDRNATRGNHGYNNVIERASGALQVIPESDDPATMASGNDALQDEIRWLFPRGTYSPVAPILDDAHYYLVDDSTLLDEACINDRPKGIILVTDGEVHFDECYTDGVIGEDLDGNGLLTDCDSFTYDDGGPGADGTYNYPESYYQTSEYQAQRLLDDTGFPTYVIGFNASAEANAKLTAIATAGGTCDKVPGCYYTADDEDQLRFAFAQIIDNLMAESQVVSRTHPVTTTRTSFRLEEAGYYELSAKYTRSSLGAWKGTLERVTFKCDDSGNMAIDSVVDFADIVEAQSSRTLITPLIGTALGLTIPSLSSVCGSIPGCDSSLLSVLTTPQLADIYHSNPTIAVAPELDLALGGYREFRREWGNRDTMLYVGTNDGLLHAFTLADIDESGDTEGEERWAYIPRTIHDKLALAQTEHVLTVDGTPVVKDVRLSRFVDGNGDVQEDWATVLIGTMRSGGRGFFALDISDPDEPVYLWEYTASDLDVDLSSLLFGNASVRPFQRLGYTYGKPAVGSIVVEDGSGDRYEAAVAIVPAGLSSGTDTDEGKALYVIEIATGKLLREFTALSGGEAMAEISGSVAGYSTVPGTLMTRAFVGDASGRLLRLDLSDADPDNWTLDVFVDPVGEGLLTDLTPQVERVMAAPSISRDREGNLVVHYGTGDVSSLSPVTEFDNYVVSVTERTSLDSNGAFVAEPEVNWLVELEDGAKLTGSPLVFNNTVYFPTLENGVGVSQCGGDEARLWAAHFTDTTSGELKPMVDLDGDGDSDTYTDFAAGTVIFGIDVAVRPACYDTEENGGVYTMKTPQATTPQLVLQTGNAPYGENTPPNTSTTPVGSDEVVDKVRIDLPPPPTTLRTTSWGAVYE